MNEDQHTAQKSSRIASHIMRILAIIGLLAVLALTAWLVVQGVRYAGGGNLPALVSGITSIFSSAPDERIGFDLPTRTFPDGREAEIRWIHDGVATEGNYRFSYSCNRNVALEVREGASSRTLPCGETFTTDESQMTVVPRSPESRFADIELRVEHNQVFDTTIVTVVNEEVTLNAGAVIPPDTQATTTPEAPVIIAEEPTPAPTPLAPTPATPAPAPSQPTVTAPRAPAPVYTPPAPRPRTPADLAVNIVETGLYLEVAGRDTFFPISPIPSDKRAGMVFTVTNRGEQQSGAWAFIAHLPTESDPKYRYVSPLQQPLAPGMQVQFTLGFDTLPDTKHGVVKIELVPTQATDLPGNNIDAAIVTFK